MAGCRRKRTQWNCPERVGIVGRRPLWLGRNIRRQDGGRTTLGTELSVSGPFAASVEEGIPASVRVASQSATTKVRVTHMRLTAPQPATRAAS